MSHTRMAGKHYIRGTAMDLKQLYTYARHRHRALNRDVVHDMYLKFGSDAPSTAYLKVCIRNAKPDPVQQSFTDADIDLYTESAEDKSVLLYEAIERIRATNELDVDIFLECCVNSSYTKFSEYSGIPVSSLRRSCNKTKQLIRDEYYRLARITD